MIVSNQNSNWVRFHKFLRPTWDRRRLACQASPGCRTSSGRTGEPPVPRRSCDACPGKIRHLDLQSGSFAGPRNDAQFSANRAHALFHHEWAASGFLEFGMSKTSSELETAAVVLNRERPGAALARQPHQNILRATVTANVGQRLAKNASQLAADRRRETDFSHITDKLRPDARVLPIARDHARQEIH